MYALREQSFQPPLWHSGSMIYTVGAAVLSQRAEVSRSNLSLETSVAALKNRVHLQTTLKSFGLSGSAHVPEWVELFFSAKLSHAAPQ